eukprot:1670459-Amphidinium_carterae.1
MILAFKSGKLKAFENATSKIPSQDSRKARIAALVFKRHMTALLHPVSNYPGVSNSPSQKRTQITCELSGLLALTSLF